MRHGLGVGLVLLLIACGLHGATPDAAFTSQGLLTGEWEATEGDMLVQVQLLADRSVIVRGGKLTDGQEAGVRFGTYKPTGRGVWSVVIRDDRGRAYNFSMVLNRNDFLTVVDGKGNHGTLQRVHVSFDKLDKNHDGVISEEEIDDPVMSRRLYEWKSRGGHQIDRQTFARFMEKQALHRAGK